MANQIVLVPQKLLENPPSVREGLSLAMEQQQRIYGCHLIQKAGVLLRLEAVSIASAQTILHRFFFRRSLNQFDVRRVATASLLLACKLEEDPRRVMHLIGVIWLLSQLEDQPNMQLKEETLDNFIIDFDSQEYELFRMDVFRCERYILRELGFMVSQTLVHPHRYILQYIHALFKDNFVFTNQLSQKAWGYLNDSMRTTLCCEVQPAVIAVGSIFLAACDLGIPLPREIGWYELFDVSWDDVIKVCSTILSLYTLPLPSYLKLADGTRPLQKTPSGGGAASTVRSTLASASTSCKTRTTQLSVELAKAGATEGSAKNRSDSRASRVTCQLPSSSITGRSLFTSQSGFAGRNSADVKDFASASAIGASHSDKESPSLIKSASGDVLEKTPLLSKTGPQTTSAASDRRISQDELLIKSTARFSRAQPRAPPPLKERGQMTVHLEQDVQATSSARDLTCSPSSVSSLNSFCRGDTRTSSSNQSNMSCTGSGSCSSAGNGDKAGHAAGAVDPLSGTRSRITHFPSSRAFSSSDKATRPGSTSAATRRSSPRGTNGRDSEPSVWRDSVLSPTPSGARSIDREERSRGRQERGFEASRRGSNSGIQAPCRFITAGNVAGDLGGPAAKIDEFRVCRLRQRSGSISSSNRNSTGWTRGSHTHEGLSESWESRNPSGRSDASRKDGENSAVSRHVTAAEECMQMRSNVPFFSTRDKDGNDSFQVSSGERASPQQSGSSHWQKPSRTSRFENNLSAFPAKNLSADCATYVQGSEGSCAGGLGERRQRSLSRSLRCSESIEAVAVGAGDRDRRTVKRQRRPPAPS